MLKRLFKSVLFIVFCAAGMAAHAQTACPQVTQGQVWTTQQWNSCFASLAAASGGTLTNTIITGGSVTGATVTPTGGIGAIVSVVTSAGSIVPGVVLNETIVVNKTVPAATSIILPASSNWPLCPSTASTSCPVYIVKDGAGNAATYPITVTTVDSKTIDGAASSVISSNYGYSKYILNGTQWNVIP